MGPNYIALAIPFFFVMIALELGVARLRRADVYDFSDTFGDVGCGMAQQTANLFLVFLKLAGYTVLYDRYRVHTFESPILVWVFAFFAVDFMYYWWHRLSHRVSLLWAAHVVHHQSEEYNLSVALRQSVLTGFTSWPFYVPVALLGVPPMVLAATIAFSTLYQFWIHTRLIGTLGPLEWALNTPSHHRGHHAVNPRYIDTNYGATLIVWDRLFGTFAQEIEAPVYGVTKPLRSFDPVWAQIAPWVDLGRAMRAAPGLLNKLRVVVMPPGWVPGEGGGREVPAPEVSASRSPPFRGAAPAGVMAYVAVNTLLLVAATFFVLLRGDSLPRALVATIAGLIVLSLASFGALLDGRRWGAGLEVARLASIAAALAAWLA